MQIRLITSGKDTAPSMWLSITFFEGKESSIESDSKCLLNSLKMLLSNVSGLIFLSFKGMVKVKYNTIINNSIFRTDDALYKVSKGYSEQEVLDKLKEYVISSKAPCKIWPLPLMV